MRTERHLWIFLTGLCLCLASTGEARAAKYQEIEVTDGAAVRGRVTFEGDIPELTLMVNSDRAHCDHEKGAIASPRLTVDAEGGVANAVVYLKDVSAGKPLAQLTAPGGTLDQLGCLYDPFVQVIPYKKRLMILNSDPLNHNIHAHMAGQGDPFNYAMPNPKYPEKQELESKALYRAGLMSISCDVHMWMNAYVWVVRHPYYAVTAADGTFELTDVPPGEYELVLWHAGWEAELRHAPDGSIMGYRYADAVEKVVPIAAESGAELTVDFVVND